MRTTLFSITLAGVLAAAPAYAQVIVYDNTSGYTGSGYVAGAAGTTSQGTVTITQMLSDDIKFAPNSAGQIVSEVTFSVLNVANTPTGTHGRVFLRIYADDNGGSAPGTVLAGLTIQAFPIDRGLLSYEWFPAPGQLVIPSTNSLWAGILFDNGTTFSPASATEMQGLGVGIFSTYTVGSSTNTYFESPAPSSGTYLVNDPVGTALTANPSGSFGWQFQTVPEPSSLALLGVAGFGLARLRRRLRPNA